MKPVRPEAGLVIRYSYLWAEEHQRGQEEGLKDRPCAVILAVNNQDQSDRVSVVPITHTAPTDPDDAVEIPLATKNRLGLDSGRSWIVVTEVNIFSWPGPDLRPMEIAGESRVDYGMLPPKLFAKLRDNFTKRIRRRLLSTVPRTD